MRVHLHSCCDLKFVVSFSAKVVYFIAKFICMFARVILHVFRVLEILLEHIVPPSPAMTDFLSTAVRNENKALKDKITDNEEVWSVHLKSQSNIRCGGGIVEVLWFNMELFLKSECAHMRDQATNDNIEKHDMSSLTWMTEMTENGIHESKVSDPRGPNE